MRVAPMQHEFGWLSPEGEFYICQLGRHGEAIKALGFSSSYAAERLGWWRLMHDGQRRIWSGELDATELQRYFIAVWHRQRGLALEPRVFDGLASPQSKRFANGY